MVRMRVDLPLPEGPMMTTTSLVLTVRLMLRSAWKLPYHLLTLLLSSPSAYSHTADPFGI